MNKRGGWALVFSLLILFIFIAWMFVFSTSYTPLAEKKLINKAISNISKEKSPYSDLSVTEIEKSFNETTVYYFLDELKVSKLHSILLSNEIPRINVLVDNVNYSATVTNGKIAVKKGAISNADILIKTSRSEIAQMLQDKNYVSESFKNGRSSLELKVDKTTLFAKGYKSIYTSLTGKTISKT